MIPHFQNFKHVQSFIAYEAHNLSFIPHIHSHYELVYVTQGSVQVTVDSITYDLSPHDLCFIASHSLHSFHTPHFSNCILVIIDTQYITSFTTELQKKKIASPLISFKPYQEELHQCISILSKSNPTTSNQLILKGYLCILLGRIYECSTLLPKTHTYLSTLESILIYMNEHYTTSLTLSQVASDLNLSKYYLSKLFNTHLGYGFNEYLNHLRINLAKNLLLESHSSITSISYECGFENQRSFNRAFKTITHFTPSEYRSNYQNRELSK
ncbi:MAG: AraC family transcriptional regulator [Cellulosilyticaceae bacterium]